MSDIEVKLVNLENTPDYNIIIGKSHFIKTVEDIHELVVGSLPNAQFGLAFCEASGPKLIRTTGTNKECEEEATRMAQKIGAGHSFVLVLKDMFPINILPRLKQVPEVVTLYCATANAVQVVLGKSMQGTGILGVIDGGSPLGVETEDNKKERKDFLRQIGYKE